MMKTSIGVAFLSRPRKGLIFYMPINISLTKKHNKFCVSILNNSCSMYNYQTMNNIFFLTCTVSLRAPAVLPDTANSLAHTAVLLGKPKLTNLHKL